MAATDPGADARPSRSARIALVSVGDPGDQDRWRVHGRTRCVVKTCPYCAEQIQDLASSCRFCGSDLTQSETAAQEVERPLALTHMGPRYALGSGPDLHGIWDSAAPGRPVRRFPRTDAGWQQAWIEFQALEPAGAPVGGTGSPPSRNGIAAGMSGSVVGAGAVQRGNGPAVGALVLGIVGILFSFLPAIGLLLGIVAIVFAWLGIRRANEGASGRGLAVAGLVLGILATLVGVLVIAVFQEVTDQLGRLDQ